MQTGITTWCSLSQVELGCHCALGKIPRNAPSPNNSTHRLLDVIIAHLIITFLLHHIILIILIITVILLLIIVIAICITLIGVIYRGTLLTRTLRCFLLLLVGTQR